MDMQNSNSGNRYPDNSYLFHKLPQYATDKTSDTALSETQAEGMDVNGLMTLFINNPSARQLARKVVQYNGAAVLGALAYKAQADWQLTKPLNEMTSISSHDVTQASPLPCFTDHQTKPSKELSLITILMKAMIAASKVHEIASQDEQLQLLKASDQLGFNTIERGFVDELMNREITIQEITRAISLDKHKSEIYLAAYLATNGSRQSEKDFLENLASEMNLPHGLTIYLERQATLGIES